ncbi:hypothetical protein RRG08_006032 [Elysia crispata]|uniref:Uncharacterized protein n=1 Tax=Elysia crispata TaxID=231223 RepID=A0AAE1AHU3_9GAST|nr:hypothetical protein RRG08_006032 [Elysia crispata]
MRPPGVTIMQYFLEGETSGVTIMQYFLEDETPGCDHNAIFLRGRDVSFPTVIRNYINGIVHEWEEQFMDEKRRRKREEDLPSATVSQSVLPWMQQNSTNAKTSSPCAEMVVLEFVEIQKSVRLAKYEKSCIFSERGSQVSFIGGFFPLLVLFAIPLSPGLQLFRGSSDSYTDLGNVKNSLGTLIHEAKIISSIAKRNSS